VCQDHHSVFCKMMRKRRASSAIVRRRRKKIRATNRIRPSDWSLKGNNPERIVTFRGYGFPDTLRTNLAFSQSFVLTPTALNPQQVQRFNLTSLYDPLYETGGFQPYWFDQLAAVYSRYKVLGAKITASFNYNSVTAGGVGPTLVGIQCKDNADATISSTDAGTLMSTSNTNFSILSANYDTKTVTATYSPSQAYGDVVTESLTASTSSNPGRNWLAHVFIQPQGTLLTTVVNVFVTVEYFAEFTQQVQNAGS